jgi:hypothetical protein
MPLFGAETGLDGLFKFRFPFQFGKIYHGLVHELSIPIFA